MDRLQEELGVTTTSCAPAKVVARGRATKVVTEVAPVVEEKTMLTLLLVMAFVVLVVIII